MIKLLDTNKAMVALLTQVKDFSIESDLASADKLISFKVPKTAISRSLLLQEYFLQTATDEYVIKEINTSDEEYYEVFGKLSLDSLRGKSYLTYVSDTVALATVLVTITAGTGWTYQFIDANTKMRSLSLTNVTVYSIIMECCTVYGMEVYFDTINKVVKFYTTRGTNRGAYVYSELNLRDRDYQSDTYELVTRLYPYGKDGLTVASVNGGLEYVDNTQYTNKIIERRWVDDRYTDAQSLYDDATALLAKISKPRVSFQIDVMNLVGSRPEYNILDFQLGDTVKIIDKSNQIMDTQRIVRLVEYPLTPEKNKVDFSNSAVKYSGSNAKQIADIEQNLSSTKSELNKAIDQVTELIVNGESGYVITRYDELNKPYEILIMNTADISTATKVWRWNINGLGYSSTGYNGPYSTAITMNGQIVAEFINTGTLSADRIGSASITAEKLAANTITADKLFVLAKSLVNNYSTTSDLTGWTVTDGSIVTDATKVAPVHRVTTTTNRQILSDYFEIDPTKTYKVTLSIKSDSVDGIRYFGLHAIDKDGASLSVTPFAISTRTFGTATNNFYFWSRSGSTGGWLDMEAYILGCNVDSQSEVPEGKDVTSHCRMPTNCHRIRLRYLNYGTAGTSRTSDHFSPTVTAVDSGAIRAENIYAGTLQSVTGNSWISLDNGQFSFGNGALAWNGSSLTAQGSFAAVSGTYSAKLEAGAIKLLNSGVELGYLSIQTVGPTGPWLTAAAGASTINLAKVVGSSLYTAYKIDWGGTGGTSATHNFWGTVTLNGYQLYCGTLNSGYIAANGVITCWRVEPHLDNNDRCGTATKRWQAVHALEGNFNNLTIGANTCWAAGSMSLTTASWATVSFGKTFPSAPRVFGQYTHDFTGDIGMLKIRNISTTGFQATIGGSGFSGIAANWFAILV